MNLSYNKVKLLFVIWNEIFLNHRVVPNDSHENLLSQHYFKNSIPVIRNKESVLDIPNIKEKNVKRYRKESDNIT
jgi:hypothetical protein